MNALIDRQKGLVRYFTDFEFLPNLLASTEQTHGGQTPELWRDALKESDAVRSLLGATDLPEGHEYACIVADDAWRLVNWLGRVNT